MVERKADELQFSIWLHSEPMHDISPAEEDRIEAEMQNIVELQEDTRMGMAEEQGDDEQQAPPTDSNGDDGGEPASPSPGGA